MFALSSSASWTSASNDDPVSTRAVAISVSEPRPSPASRAAANQRLVASTASRPVALRQAVGARQPAERVEQQHRVLSALRGTLRLVERTLRERHLVARRAARVGGRDLHADRPTRAPPRDGRRRARRAPARLRSPGPVPTSCSRAVAPLPAGPAISARWPCPSGATSCTMRAASASPSASGRLGRCTGRSSKRGGRGPRKRRRGGTLRGPRATRHPRPRAPRRALPRGARSAAGPARRRGGSRRGGCGAARRTRRRRRRAAPATSPPLSAATSCSRRSMR